MSNVKIKEGVPHGIHYQFDAFENDYANVIWLVSYTLLVPCRGCNRAFMPALQEGDYQKRIPCGAGHGTDRDRAGDLQAAAIQLFL